MPLELKAKEGCCEEASRESYIPCNKPAKIKVYHKKDNRTYRMCNSCGGHNIHNRGGEFRGLFRA